MINSIWWTIIGFWFGVFAVLNNTIGPTLRGMEKSRDTMAIGALTYAIILLLIKIIFSIVP